MFSPIRTKLCVTEWWFFLWIKWQLGLTLSSLSWYIYRHFLLIRYSSAVCSVPFVEFQLPKCVISFSFDSLQINTLPLIILIIIIFLKTKSKHRSYTELARVLQFAHACVCLYFIDLSLSLSLWKSRASCQQQQANAYHMRAYRRERARHVCCQLWLNSRCN